MQPSPTQERIPASQTRSSRLTAYNTSANQHPTSHSLHRGIRRPFQLDTRVRILVREAYHLQYHGEPPNERRNNRVAVMIAPKMATGEVHAVLKVGSKWNDRWVGCGRITAHLSGTSHRSGRTFVDLLTSSLFIYLLSYRFLLRILQLELLSQAVPSSGIIQGATQSAFSPHTLT
jgi:hypothetical protein